MYSVPLSLWEHPMHDVDCIHDQGQIYIFCYQTENNISVGNVTELQQAEAL